MEPIILRTKGPDDYALIDSGGGRKLERFGAVTLNRPEDQALWAPRLGRDVWNCADAVFTGARDEEGSGRWKRSGNAPDAWPCRIGNVNYRCRLTSFRHVGVFPEQMPHWTQMVERITGKDGKSSVLNLFGYTGIASLIAADAGARVTHVDASRAAINWARDNQSRSKLDDRPIRWICDDALKFARREVRRDRRYDIILLDPPKFGRGPKNEVWHLFEHLPEMLELCGKLLDPDRGMILLTVYAIRASYLSFHELMDDHFGPGVESGELVLDSETGRQLSTSLFCRWPAT